MDVLYPLPDTCPSVLAQLARIRTAEAARRRAEALFQGILSAVFALSAGALAVLFLWAASE